MGMKRRLPVGSLRTHLSWWHQRGQRSDRSPVRFSYFLAGVGADRDDVLELLDELPLEVAITFIQDGDPSAVQDVQTVLDVVDALLDSADPGVIARGFQAMAASGTDRRWTYQRSAHQ